MIFWSSIKDKYDAHVAGFILRGAIELPFVDFFPIGEGLSVVPYQSQGLFGRVFLPEGVLLKGDVVYTI